MDPALRRLIRDGDASDEVAVLVRFSQPAPDLPEQVRIVAAFGDVATVRAPRGVLEDLRSREVVSSVKAPVLFQADDIDQPVGSDVDAADVAAQRDLRRPPGVGPTGSGVVVGVVDWGLDFCHPAFRNADGSTRLLALWDQQPGPDPARPNRYGYGRIHDRERINAALCEPNPEEELQYYPWLSDAGAGTHGTATTAIAAGSDWPAGLPGVAPGAEIVFVHASTWGRDGPHRLGDSVALAEALDFIRSTAADRPCVINLSLGGHAGPHDGCTLLERAMDAFVLDRAGLVITQSCGNYFGTDTHAEGELLAADEAVLPFEVRADTAATHEIDVWYAGSDRFTVGVIGPSGVPRVVSRPGRHRNITVDGVTIGEIQHRLDEPNDGRNNAVIRLEPSVHPGTWQVLLRSADVVDGRFHAWIERQPVPPHQQTRFTSGVAVAATTTGTICNGYRTLSVGAYDSHDPDRAVSAFSSSGPTIDGRRKPSLLAPGHRIITARSRPAELDPNGPPAPTTTVMSGTSMAAPHVAGAVACLLQQDVLTATQLRAVLLRSCAPYRGAAPGRAGDGYLDLAAALDDLSHRRGDRRRPPRADRTPYTEPIDEGVSVVTEIQDRDTSTGPGTTAAAVPDERVNRPWALYELVTAFVLDRNTSLRERLSRSFELVVGPHWRGVDALQADDVLVRAANDDRPASASLLVDGQLRDRRDAERLGWRLEAPCPPGRYALVDDGDPVPGGTGGVARRITDEFGDMPGGQAIIRCRTRVRLVHGGEVPTPFGEADTTEATLLGSPRFRDDADLVAVSAGRLRLAGPGTAPYPAPVMSSGPAVTRIQQALMDLGYPLPRFGADGRYGAEVGNAVSKFKSDWHIQPTDPVVGRLTIAALDKEMLAHDRPAPPTPTPTPPPPPPPVDPYGRRPSSAAKLPAALAAVAAFRATGAGSNWLHLDRGTVATGIAERAVNPDGAQQGGNGLCTTAAFINVWAQDAPDAYAAFATALFDHGEATLAPNQSSAGMQIKASNALMGADYAEIARRMAARGFPTPPQADWMVFSAIRDATNSLFTFTGDPDDWISHNLADGASPIGDLDSWLRNAGAWTSVVNDVNVLLNASLDDAIKLDPSRSRALLSIDTGMLLPGQSGGHTVVLRSPVTQTADGIVHLRVWTWAKLCDIAVTKQTFENTYKGANIAYL